LFRDLSDKLFTSEIIEPRGEQRLESETRLDAKHKSTEWGNSDVPQEEVSSTKISENRKLYDRQKAMTIKPTLEDLGKFILQLNLLIIELSNLSWICFFPILISSYFLLMSDVNYDPLFIRKGHSFLFIVFSYCTLAIVRRKF